MSADAIIQLVLLLAAAGCFAAAFGLGWHNMHTATATAAAEAAFAAGQPATASLGWASHLAFVVGSLVAVGLLAWRVATRHATPSPPLSNYFDLFLALGIMLAGMRVYFRLTQHLRGLGFFLLPITAVVLLFGAALSIMYRKAFDYSSIPLVVHVLSVSIGSLCFAAGCAGGAVYLLADAQIRRKGLGTGHRWVGLPSLAAMERFNQYAVLLGFPLLTVAMITGGMGVHPRSDRELWMINPKVLLAIVVWLVYGMLLHVRLAPAFRGRRAAWLSIVGFVLLLAVFVAVLWMPKGAS